MIPRYENPRIAEIFSDLAKVLRWQDVELAVIEARVQMGHVPEEQYKTIRSCLRKNPPELEVWYTIEKERHHDLQAFIEERRRFIPVELRYLFHQDMTSYDTEEPAFALALRQACEVVDRELEELCDSLVNLSKQHRFVPMLGRTHGQGAELQSFGKRILTWHRGLQIAIGAYQSGYRVARSSRIAGPIGNYGELEPEIERRALVILGLDPFLGSTQIMPRELHAHLAQGLNLIAKSIGKIAVDLRLGARSPRPLYQEPFGKAQRGSSAMPHKRNTILGENLEGMMRLAAQWAHAIEDNVITWEERAIEQSSVERVAWPDLFHVVLRMIKVMTKVLNGLKVYPDHMLQEIIDARGTHAASAAKNFLARHLAKRGADTEIAYSIIQLAAFCVFKPIGLWAETRSAKILSLAAADQMYWRACRQEIPRNLSIEYLIRDAGLFPVEELDITEKEVAAWNRLLREIFADETVADEWHALFHPSRLLQHEKYLFTMLS